MIERTRWRRIGWCACAGLPAWYAFTVLTPQGQHLDLHVYGTMLRNSPNWMKMVTNSVGRQGGPIASSTCALLLAAWAIARRDWVPCLRAVAVVFFSTCVAWVLRTDVLWRPELHNGAPHVNTMPSTHTAIVASTATAIVLLWPDRPPKWLILVMVVYVALGALGNILSYAHLPSDVVAALILTTAICCLVLSVPIACRSRPTALRR